MDVTRRQATNYARIGEVNFRGPANGFIHVREFPPADFRDVVRPNFDTLYSSAWLDLTREPMVLSLPDTSGPDGRYHLMPMLNMWSNVFASPRLARHAHHGHGGRRLRHRGARMERHLADWHADDPCPHAACLDHRPHRGQGHRRLRDRSPPAGRVWAGAAQPARPVATAGGGHVGCRRGHAHPPRSRR
jgi:hypothetical protein